MPLSLSLLPSLSRLLDKGPPADGCAAPLSPREIDVPCHTAAAPVVHHLTAAAAAALLLCLLSLYGDQRLPVCKLLLLLLLLLLVRLGLLLV